jgi:D-alanyl-D-alanine carboxypeptidase
MAVALLILVSACGTDSTSSPSSATATTNTAGTEAAHDIDAGTAQRLDAAIDQVMTAASIPGAIIGIWGPEGRYVRAVGVADKATGAPMKTDVYSRIGSMTKTFTITAILQLADQGKIGLDDPIGKYIDGVPNGDEIALRELARMRSGLENYANTTEFQQALVADPYRNFTPQELLGYAFAKPPVFPPGQGWGASSLRASTPSLQIWFTVFASGLVWFSTSTTFQRPRQLSDQFNGYTVEPKAAS